MKTTNLIAVLASKVWQKQFTTAIEDMSDATLARLAQIHGATKVSVMEDGRGWVKHWTA